MMNFRFAYLLFLAGSLSVFPSCLPMLGASQLVAGNQLTNKLFSSSSSLKTVWSGNIESFPSYGLSTPDGFKISPAESYSLLINSVPNPNGIWICVHDEDHYYWHETSGLKEEAEKMSAVRRGIAINGQTGKVELSGNYITSNVQSV